jgi:hypothetical protein
MGSVAMKATETHFYILNQGISHFYRMGFWKLNAY